MGCRCYERLQPNTKEFTRLAYTELNLGMEYIFFSDNLFFWKENQEMDEDPEKRAIEDLPVVSSVRSRRGQDS